MPQYKYSALGADGVPVRGVIDAYSSSALENDLLINGHSNIRIAERKPFTQIEITRERVPSSVIMHFSRQLAAFVRTGIPLNEGIRIVNEGVENRRFKRVLSEVEDSIQAGVPFSQAMAEHSQVFPPYYVSILRSAELSGHLDSVLEQLASYIERDSDARSKVVSALIYPAVVLGMVFIVVGVMVVFVLPRFVDFFDQVDAKLPLPTRMLIGLSDFVGRFWWLLAILALIAAGVGWFVGRSDGGKLTRHRLLLRMPVIGTIVEYSIVERFCRVIGAMMRSGVPLPEAMSAATESANNEVFRIGLQPAREAMIQGDGIAGPIDDTALFPLAATQMMRVGEETGTLDVQMEGAASYYARELEYKLTRLSTLFEPIVIVIMGLIVGFVALALVSAMYGAFNSGALN